MTPRFSVRRAHPEDLDACLAVIATVACERRYILTEPEDLDRGRLERTLAPDSEDALWVLEENGRVVGVAGLHQTGVTGVASVGISLLPEARGRGGGRTLLRAVMEHARRASMHKLELEVFTDNAPAISLYATQGFAIEGVRRRHHLRRDGSRRDALMMARILE